jgi:hypothetical protein
MARMMKQIVMAAAVLLAFVVGTTGQARAGLLINGDFETGNLSGWSVFTTSNGNNGAGLPNVVPFDTTGSGASNAAQFVVGEATFTGVYEGGGISQTFSFGGGTLDLSADVAAYCNYQGNSFNASGGRFELLLNNIVVSTFEVDQIALGQTIRGQLSATETGLAAGSYTLAVRITRPYLNGIGVTPYEYVDNVNAADPPAVVPEPSTLSGAGIAVFLSLTCAWRRWRAKHAA